MKFNIKKNENILSLTRRLGYALKGVEGEEFNCVRCLSGSGYPRFHLYIKQEKDNIYFNLHLDQKKPSYQGTSAHSGEYEGELVGQEKERIIKAMEEE
jgi:hypothetical protein